MNPRSYGQIRFITAVAVAASLLWCGSAQASKNVALVIGNSAYRTVPASRQSDQRRGRDAAMRSSGWASRSRGSTMRPTTRCGARSWNSAARRAAPSMAVVFYAGHGIEVGGENWLIPIDAELEERHRRRARGDRPEGRDAHGRKRLQARPRHSRCLPQQSVRREDAANASARAAVARGLRPGSSRPATCWWPMPPRTARSRADGDGRNSPFTAALLRHIETPGLEINFLFRNVRDDVMSGDQPRAAALRLRLAVEGRDLSQAGRADERGFAADVSTRRPGNSHAGLRACLLELDQRQHQCQRIRELFEGLSERRIRAAGEAAHCRVEAESSAAAARHDDATRTDPEERQVLLLPGAAILRMTGGVMVHGRSSASLSRDAVGACIGSGGRFVRSRRARRRGGYPPRARGTAPIGHTLGENSPELEALHRCRQDAGVYAQYQHSGSRRASTHQHVHMTNESRRV